MIGAGSILPHGQFERSGTMASKITVEEANAFLEEAFESGPERSRVTHMEDGIAVMRLEVTNANLRPGGYISGPTQMGMCDSAAYMAVMTKVGITPMAVTSSLTMNFLRPCVGEAVEAEAEVMRIGRSLAVMDVTVRVAGSAKTCSHAVVTYALPKAEED